ncbi:MAG: DUF1178 family protein [Parvularculaceae bacterium]
MIKYQLKCASGCSFEGWFPSSDHFEREADAGRLECPSCGVTEVSRDIMAPALVRRASVSSKKSSGEDRAKQMNDAMADAARRARDYVEKNFDYVGERFPEEARRIHYGETKERAIYGEATKADAKELVDEGVAVAPLPTAATPAKKDVN